MRSLCTRVTPWNLRYGESYYRSNTLSHTLSLSLAQTDFSALRWGIWNLTPESRTAAFWERIPCTRVNRDTLSPYSGGCARRCCSPAVLELAPEAAMLADAGAPAVALAPALAAVVLALPAPPLRYALPLPLPPLSHQFLPLIHSFVVSARKRDYQLIIALSCCRQPAPRST